MMETRAITNVSLKDRDQCAGLRTVLQREQKVIGCSPRILHCLKMAEQTAESTANVVIHGETGTGKDLFARMIHNKGRPPLPGRFVVIDCRAPENETLATLIGADDENLHHKGIQSLASCGTLCLDDIDDLPLRQQKVLCLLLQDKWFLQKIEHQRVKIIATCQQNLEKMALKGEFRNDLLTLLQSSRIDLPPLRDRTEDIVELTRYFLCRFSVWHGIPAKKITPEFNAMLMRYAWPGNIRELANTLEQSLLLARYEATLFPKHLPNYIRIQVTKSSLLRHFSPE